MKTQLPNGVTVETVPFAEARSIVTASAVGAIMGLNPFMDSCDVYNRIVHGHQKPATAPMKAGQYMEPGILQWYKDEVGAQLVAWPQTKTAVHEAIPYLGATPDGLAIVNGTHVIAEAKNASVYRGELFDNGECPPYYEVQGHVQAMVLRYDHFQVAAVVGGNDLRISRMYSVDPERTAAITEAVAKFWRDNITKQVPPPVRTAEQALVLWPREEPGKTIEATKGVYELFLKWKQYKRTIKETEDVVSQQRDELAAYMADAETLTYQGQTLITYKAQKPGYVFDQDAWAQSDSQGYDAYLAAQERWRKLKSPVRVMLDKVKA